GGSVDTRIWVVSVQFQQPGNQLLSLGQGYFFRVNLAQTQDDGPANGYLRLLSDSGCQHLGIGTDGSKPFDQEATKGRIRGVLEKRPDYFSPTHHHQSRPDHHMPLEQCGSFFCRSLWP